MIGDPQSIKAFKTSITPENVKFFWDSDSDRICSDPYHFAFRESILFGFSCVLSDGTLNAGLKAFWKYLATLDSQLMIHLAKKPSRAGRLNADSNACIHPVSYK